MAFTVAYNVLFSELASKVAVKLQFPPAQVERIIKTFLEEIIVTLLDGENVHLPEFGIFFSKRGGRGGHDRRNLFFRSSQGLRRRFREEARTVNKYAVVLDKDLSALAKLTGKCPRCNTPLLIVDPPQCASCGTQPFEPQPQTEEAPVVEEPQEEAGPDHKKVDW